MASLTYSQQQQILKKYLAAEIKNYETASALVMQKTAARLRQVTAAELKKFKRGAESRGNFHKAVKQYDFPRSKGPMGPASFVRVGIPFIDIFEEGGTVQGQPQYLIILLPTGDRLGYKRVKPNGWDAVWRKIKDRAVLIPVSDGYFVGLKSPGGKPVLIYKFQKQVTVPKKINFFGNAEKLAENMPEEINRLIK